MMYSEASSGRGLGERLQDFEGSELKQAKKRGGKREEGRGDLLEGGYE